MDDRAREWLISLCLVLLSCAAVWTVFGDDLAAFVAGQPVEASAKVGPAEPTTKGAPAAR